MGGHKKSLDNHKLQQGTCTQTAVGWTSVLEKKKLFKNSEGKPLHIYIQELTRSDGRNGVLSSTRSGGGTLVGAGGTACLRLGWVGRGGTGRLPDQEAVQEPSASATRGDALPLAHPD